MRYFAVIILVAVTACSPRAELASLPAAALGPQADATAQAAPAGRRILPVFIGTTRKPDPDPTIGFGSARSETLTLARYDIAIPPQHRSGNLSVPVPNKTPDPNRDFLVAKAQTFARTEAFRSALAAQLVHSKGEAVVFVHGYNTNFAEGLYRYAQMGADYGLPNALVQFSWPSMSRVMGYAYDRESALAARDGLQHLLDQVRAAGAKKILLVAHSMGGFLTMETLRQMALSGDRQTLQRISSVVLISPDIDVDVFRAQAHSIGRLPQPFLVFTSGNDKALRISAQISGEPRRLGNLSDINAVSDLSVTMIDTGAYDTNAGHFNVADSPALIDLLKNPRGLAQTLAGEQARHTDPFASAALGVNSASRIVLRPIEALGDALIPN